MDDARNSAFTSAAINAPPSASIATAERHEVDQAALRLAQVNGIGPRLYRALIDQFGSASAALAAAPSQLRGVPGIGAKLARAIVEQAPQIDIAAQLALCREHQVSLLSIDRPHYPTMLREIADPPPVLYQLGAWQPRDALALAIVGSRHATAYGLIQAERLAGSLARAGLTIISGLARGIDAAAHRGALAAGGRTVAVLGSGVLRIYPPEHTELAQQIVANGAVMSESPPLAEPLGGLFPQRNRILSGLSLGVLVVEAALSSGALITARHALEQGRAVFAVPGRVDSRSSQGCHRLIRDGAKLVESADDVLEELGPLSAPTVDGAGQTIQHPAELLLNELEQQVLAAIECSATSIDRIVAVTGLPIPQVLSTLSVLEMRRIIRRVGGSQVLRV